MKNSKRTKAYRIFLFVMVVLLILGIWTLVTGVRTHEKVMEPKRITPTHQGGRMTLVA